MRLLKNAGQKLIEMIKSRLIILWAVFLLTACNSAGDKKVMQPADSVAPIKLITDTNAIASAIDSLHTAQNSIEWDGVYKGVLPCADCSGIETELVLFKDQTYTITRKYLGKGSTINSDGKTPFSWINGNTIRLDGVIDGPSMYLVGEGTVTQLDINGNLIKGALKDKYVLKKQQQ